MKKITIAFLITFAAAYVTPATAGEAAGATGTDGAGITHSPRKLDGQDLDGYCRSQGKLGAKSTGNTAYDWRCTMPDSRLSDIYFGAVCHWQYPDRFVVDRIDNFYDPHSLECWQVSASSSKDRPAFASYRKVQGADDAVLIGKTASDWRCTTRQQATQLIPINARDARLRTLNVAAVDRFDNFYDPWSWQCWV